VINAPSIRSAALAALQVVGPTINHATNRDQKVAFSLFALHQNKKKIIIQNKTFQSVLVLKEL